MCGCGKYPDGEGYFGIVKGVLEMHTPSHCVTKKVSKWRPRVFGPIAGFFRRLCGEDHRDVLHYLKTQAAMKREREIDERRKQRRRLIAGKWDELNKGE